MPKDSHWNSRRLYLNFVQRGKFQNQHAQIASRRFERAVDSAGLVRRSSALGISERGRMAAAYCPLRSSLFCERACSVPTKRGGGQLRGVLAVWRFARVRPGVGVALPSRYPRRVWIGVASSSNLISVPGYVEEEIPYDVYAETGRTSCVADAGCDGPVRLVRASVC